MNTYPVVIGIIITHYKDPGSLLNNQNSMESKGPHFFSVASHELSEDLDFDEAPLPPPPPLPPLPPPPLQVEKPQEEVKVDKKDLAQLKKPKSFKMET